LARPFPHDGPSGLEHPQQDQVLAQHLLLPAKTAADALGEHMQISVIELEDVAKLLVSGERTLRAGTDMNPPTPSAPANRSQCFGIPVLDPRGRIGMLVNSLGRLEASLDTADLTLNIDEQIAFLRTAAGVQYRRGRLQRLNGVEHRRQDRVFHLE